MARSFQQMIILGQLGGDPELRHTANGNPVATFSVATSDSYKDKQTDQWVETTEWHRIVAWNRNAEIASEYLRKGRMVHITGKKKTRKYQDQSGKDNYIVEIVVDSLILIGAKMEQRGAAGDNSGPVHQSQDSQPQQAQPAQAPAGGDFGPDDDIPI